MANSHESPHDDRHDGHHHGHHGGHRGHAVVSTLEVPKDKEEKAAARVAHKAEAEIAAQLVPTLTAAWEVRAMTRSCLIRCIESLQTTY